MNLFIKKQSFFWQKTLVTVGALLVLLMLLNLFQAQIRNSFYSLSSPLSKNFLHGGNATAGVFNSLFTFTAVQQENANLKQENEKLFAQITALQDTAARDQALKTALENTQADNFRLLATQTVGLDGVRDSLTINKGSADGVAENMPLISKDKVVYGRVSKVYAHFSEVSLVSQKDGVLNVQIPSQEATGKPVYGAVKGSGNFSAYLDLVNSDASINPGDVLVTSGLEGIFPKNLLVGKILAISQNDAKAFQQAKIQPFFDSNDIENLFVIMGNK